MSLRSLRKQIDGIDRTITKLLNLRAKITWMSPRQNAKVA